MAEVKDAKKVITLDDIQYNEENKVLAAISVFPLIGLIMFFVEKDDLFVRYYGAQFMWLGLLFLVVWIPCVGWLINVAGILVMIIGFVKALQGERFDVPLLSDLGLKAMNAVQ